MVKKTNDKFDFMDQELARRQKRHLLRRLRSVRPRSAVEIEVDGRRVVNFCANDYLGLSKHPLIRERAAAYMAEFGAGSTASRLITGNIACFDNIERKLAALKQEEAALVFNSGYQANVSVIPAISGSDALILSDRLNHNSIISGIRLSRAAVGIYGHNDLHHLQQLLAENADKGYARTVIVTESLFSMDGDMADLSSLVELSRKFNAILVVDDAHATGVLGENGMGLTCGLPIDVVIGTFSKGCGVFGAYVAGSRRLRDYLINCCPGFIYTTALPPQVLGAIDASLDLIPEMGRQREKLQKNAERLRQALNRMGWQTGRSRSQIIPIIVGSESDTLSLSAWLSENGILATAIRPPTVPQGTARIRIALSAQHTDAHLEQLIDAFAKWRQR